MLLLAICYTSKTLFTAIGGARMNARCPNPIFISHRDPPRDGVREQPSLDKHRRRLRGRGSGRCEDGRTVFLQASALPHCRLSRNRKESCRHRAACCAARCPLAERSYDETTHVYHAVHLP